MALVELEKMGILKAVITQNIDDLHQVSGNKNVLELHGSLKRWYCLSINIHPSLLPKYGGKGMYGAYVHQAVIDHGEKESGITIHYVNEHYDEGNIIFQAKTEVLPTDTADTLAEKIHQLEYQHFPEVISRFAD